MWVGTHVGIVCVAFSASKESDHLYSLVWLVVYYREPQPVEALAEKIQATGDDSGLVSFTPRKIDIK